MVKLLVFNILLLACCAYAFLRGGAPERTGAAILLVGIALTVIAASGPANRFGSVELGILIVDAATLVAFIALALRAERFWPTWVAGLQLIGTAAHAVKLVDPEMIRWAYAFMLAFWSYPMLFLLALGTWRHQRRLTRLGADKSWSTFSSPWATRRRTGPTG